MECLDLALTPKVRDDIGVDGTNGPQGLNAEKVEPDDRMRVCVEIGWRS